MIDTLVSGKQVLHALTIPEGLTSLQAVDRLRENDILVGDIKTIPPEGSLMPDTYKFSRGTKREQLIKIDAAGGAARWWPTSGRTARPTRRSARPPNGHARLDRGKGNRQGGRAAARRRRVHQPPVKNMPLQSDPTIVYGLVGGKGTLGRGILKSEVEQKTPYNTYAIAGLPPGPIANPGRAALEAVANPSKTKDLYFVADGTGGHAFAETLDQHKANVLRWRQIEKDAKDKLAPDADKAGPQLPDCSAEQAQSARRCLGRRPGVRFDWPLRCGWAGARRPAPARRRAGSRCCFRLRIGRSAFAARFVQPAGRWQFKEVDIDLARRWRRRRDARSPQRSTAPSRSRLPRCRRSRSRRPVRPR